jgi:hypothetical protein
MIEYSVDGIITDYPEKVKEICQNKVTYLGSRLAKKEVCF